MITGLPIWRHSLTTSFCATGREGHKGRQGQAGGSLSNPSQAGRQAGRQACSGCIIRPAKQCHGIMLLPRLLSHTSTTARHPQQGTHISTATSRHPHRPDRRTWMEGTFSKGSCAPRSPRATITPSAAPTISSRLGIASQLSICGRGRSRGCGGHEQYQQRAPQVSSSSAAAFQGQ